MDDFNRNTKNLRSRLRWVIHPTAQTIVFIDSGSTATRYLAVLVVYDDDEAGEKGREYITRFHAKFSRVKSIQPPAHDLTDFWKSGGDLRGWLAGHVSSAMDDALKGMDMTSHAGERLAIIAWMVKNEACLSITGSFD